MNDTGSVRADVWLWAARFFKTRRLAREAIDGGKVVLNAAVCKPSKLVKAGDRLQVTKGQDQFVVTVEGVAKTRGPAQVAETLYVEDEASRKARAERRETARLSRPVKPDKRPDKGDRRKLRRLKHGDF